MSVIFKRRSVSPAQALDVYASASVGAAGLCEIEGRLRGLRTPCVTRSGARLHLFYLRVMNQTAASQADGRQRMFVLNITQISICDAEQNSFGVFGPQVFD